MPVRSQQEVIVRQLDEESERGTHTSARAACTAALRTFTATTGLRAATAVSKGSRDAVSYGKTRNSGVPVVDAEYMRNNNKIQDKAKSAI